MLSSLSRQLLTGYRARALCLPAAGGQQPMSTLSKAQLGANAMAFHPYWQRILTIGPSEVQEVEG